MSIISVVHEFEVLYSTRLHQKDKRWSDGRLKFYEFNNKIEVYSDNNVLVCSDFYPHKSRNPLENGYFADGKTYTLPSGKMVVEFSEYLGCSERDISNLFVKKEPQRVSVKTEPRGDSNQELRQMRFGQQIKRELSPNCINLEPEPCPSTSGPKSVSELVSRSKISHKRVGLSRSRHTPKRVSPEAATPARRDLEHHDCVLPRFKGRILPGSNKTLQRLQVEAGSGVDYGSMIKVPPDVHDASHENGENNWASAENPR